MITRTHSELLAIAWILRGNCIMFLGLSSQSRPCLKSGQLDPDGIALYLSCQIYWRLKTVIQLLYCQATKQTSNQNKAYWERD
jgi:hypothetical protein